MTVLVHYISPKSHHGNISDFEKIQIFEIIKNKILHKAITVVCQVHFQNTTIS